MLRVVFFQSGKVPLGLIVIHIENFIEAGLRPRHETGIAKVPSLQAGKEQDD
jgi:hypothetical protein